MQWIHCYYSTRQLDQQCQEQTQFINELLDPNNLFVSSNVEVYSYSIVKLVVLSYLKLFQLKALPFKIKYILNDIHYFSNISLKKILIQTILNFQFIFSIDESYSQVQDTISIVYLSICVLEYMSLEGGVPCKKDKNPILDSSLLSYFNIQSICMDCDNLSNLLSLFLYSFKSNIQVASLDFFMDKFSDSPTLLIKVKICCLLTIISHLHKILGKQHHSH